jgi:hypothetical protein
MADMVRRLSTEILPKNKKQNESIKLPEPPYGNMSQLLEQNIYKVQYNDSYYFVRILGVGPSTDTNFESFAIIQYLCTEQQEEVNRKAIRKTNKLFLSNLHFILLEVGFDSSFIR